MQSTDQGTLETWVFHMRLSLEWKLVSMYAPTWHAPHTQTLSVTTITCMLCMCESRKTFFFLNTLLILFSGLSLFKSLIQERRFHERSKRFVWWLSRSTSHQKINGRGWKTLACQPPSSPPNFFSGCRTLELMVGSEGNDGTASCLCSDSVQTTWLLYSLWSQGGGSDVPG